jgi:hypothetical protein
VRSGDDRPSSLTPATGFQRVAPFQPGYIISRQYHGLWQHRGLQWDRALFANPDRRGSVLFGLIVGPMVVLYHNYFPFPEAHWLAKPMTMTMTIIICSSFNYVSLLHLLAKMFLRIGAGSGAPYRAVARRRPPWFIVFYRSTCVLFLCVIWRKNTSTWQNLQKSY